MSEFCDRCVKAITIRPTVITCSGCSSKFHVKCAGISTRDFCQSNIYGWLCNDCNVGIFPMATLSDSDVVNEFSVFSGQSSAPHKKN